MRRAGRSQTSRRRFLKSPSSVLAFMRHPPPLGSFVQKTLNIGFFLLNPVKKKKRPQSEICTQSPSGKTSLQFTTAGGVKLVFTVYLGTRCAIAVIYALFLLWFGCFSPANILTVLHSSVSCPESSGRFFSPSPLNAPISVLICEASGLFASFAHIFHQTGRLNS